MMSDGVTVSSSTSSPLSKASTRTGRGLGLQWYETSLQLSGSYPSFPFTVFYLFMRLEDIWYEASFVGRQYSIPVTASQIERSSWVLDQLQSSAGPQPRDPPIGWLKRTEAGEISRRLILYGSLHIDNTQRSQGCLRDPTVTKHWLV